MLRRTFVGGLLLFSVLSFLSCKTNQGNGLAQPQNAGKGYNPDQEKDNTRQGGAGSSSQAARTASPGPAQTPSKGNHTQ